MTRNLKVLGLALGAVFALSAMAASSASAVDTFTGPAATFPVTATGTDIKFELTSPIIKVECTTTTIANTWSNGASSATVKPSQTGEIGKTPHGTPCTSTLGGGGTVDINSCAYVLTGNTTGSDGGTDATITVECSTAGDHIVMTVAGGCQIKIPAQTPTSGGLTYTNEAGGKIKIKATMTGITYTTNNVFACQVAGIAAEGNNADYTGTLIGSSSSGAISVTSS